MKTTVLCENLQKKLSFANHAIPSKNQLPILSNFLLIAKRGKLVVGATDLEISVSTELSANTEEEGAITVPAKTFLDVLGNIKDEKVELQTKDKNLELRTKKVKAVFQTMPQDDFPKLYEEKGEKKTEIKREVIGKKFPRVVFAASMDNSRPVLSGVLIKKEKEGFIVVGTDGYRLSLERKISLGGKGVGLERSIIVPSRVIKELVSLKEGEGVEVFIPKEGNQIIFCQNQTTLVGRLIEGEFPDYEKIIPTDFSTSSTFEKEELQNAVKICSVFARETANIVRMSVKKDKIVVSSSTPSLGENTVEVEAKTMGEENEIAFNARYLLDILSIVEEENMVFEMTGPLNPGVFKIAGDDSFLHLIMPIRIQG